MYNDGTRRGREAWHISAATEQLQEDCQCNEDYRAH